MTALLTALMWAAAPPAASEKEFAKERKMLVEQHIENRGVKDPRVLRAMRTVPRHEFVPRQFRDQAYADHPLSIGYGATISQPYIVAAMTELMDVKAASKVLEIGTGSGYQAAVLSMLANEIYSMEIVPELARAASATLKELGYENVMVRHGDGYRGWPEEAPFDRIMLTAAPPEVPEALIQQLKPGGKLVAPVGDAANQTLLVIEKNHQGQIRRRNVFPVMFVPMVPGRN